MSKVKKGLLQNLMKTYFQPMVLYCKICAVKKSTVTTNKYYVGTYRNRYFEKRKT